MIDHDMIRRSTVAVWEETIADEVVKRATGNLAVSTYGLVPDEYMGNTTIPVAPDEMQYFSRLIYRCVLHGLRLSNATGWAKRRGAKEAKS